MSKIYSNILEKVGRTPLVRINRLNQGGATVLAKVEFFNPAQSVKDRIAKGMIEDAEKRGILQPGGLIILYQRGGCLPRCYKGAHRSTVRSRGRKAGSRTCGRGGRRASRRSPSSAFRAR